MKGWYRGNRAYGFLVPTALEWFWGQQAGAETKRIIGFRLLSIFSASRNKKTRSLSKSLCFFNGVQCIRRIGGWANFRPGCYCDGIRFEKYADSQKDAVSPFFPDTLYILLIPSAAGGNLSWKKTNARCNCPSLLLFLRFSIFIFIFVTRIIFLNTIIDTD